MPFEPDSTIDAFAQTLRDYYAYLDVAPVSVDDLVAEIRRQLPAARTPAALRRLLHRATFALCDPHLCVGPLTDSEPNIWPTSGDLAVDHQDHIVDVRAGSPADVAGIRPGWVLLAIDGVPTQDAARALWDGALPRQKAYTATLAANGRRDGTPRRLTLRDANGQERTIEAGNPRSFAEQISALPPLSTTKRDDGVVLIRINNSLGQQETIAAFDEAIAGALSAPAVVLDLRCTPSGGNTDVARAIIGHFIAETRAYQIHEVPAIERRTSVPRRFIEQAAPRAPRYPGRLLVLAGRWTGSMGEGLTIGLHAAAGATTIGSETGRLLGATHSFDLPLGDQTATFSLGAERLLHPDGTPRQDFVADIPLPAADRSPLGRDPAEAALKMML